MYGHADSRFAASSTGRRKVLQQGKLERYTFSVSSTLTDFLIIFDMTILIRRPHGKDHNVINKLNFCLSASSDHL